MGSRLWPTSHAERLLHLSTLLDAIALYDKVYVLQSELPPDADLLSLRNELFSAGILNVIDPAPHAEAVSKELQGFLRNRGGFTKKYHGAKESIIAEIRAAVKLSLGEAMIESRVEDFVMRSPEIMAAGLKGGYEGTFCQWWPEEHDNASDPFGALAFNILKSVGYWSSGAIVSGISNLRTFIYWRLADHLGLPWVPSSRRLPVVESLDRQVTTTISHQVYAAIAGAFNVSLEEVYEDTRQRPIKLAPAMAIFLSYYRDNKSIIKSLSKLRSDFAGVRRAATNLHQKLAESETIAERLKAKRRFQLVMAELLSHHSTNSVELAISESITCAPQVMGPLSSPTDPSEYSSALLKKPFDWLRKWWCMRPFRSTFAVHDRLRAIRSYSTLADEALGLQLNDEEVSYLERYFDHYASMYAGAKRAASKENSRK